MKVEADFKEYTLERREYMELMPQSELVAMSDEWYNQLKWWATDFEDMAIIAKEGERTKYEMPEDWIERFVPEKLRPDSYKEKKKDEL